MGDSASSRSSRAGHGHPAGAIAERSHAAHSVRARDHPWSRVREKGAAVPLVTSDLGASVGAARPRDRFRTIYARQEEVESTSLHLCNTVMIATDYALHIKVVSGVSLRHSCGRSPTRRFAERTRSGAQSPPADEEYGGATASSRWSRPELVTAPKKTSTAHATRDTIAASRVIDMSVSRRCAISQRAYPRVDFPCTGSYLSARGSGEPHY